MVGRQNPGPPRDPAQKLLYGAGPGLVAQVALSPPPNPMLVSLVGELDAAAFDGLGDLVTEHLHLRAADVRIDLDGVTFCDVRGVEALVATRRRARHLGRDLVLERPRPHVLAVLRLCGVEGLVHRRP